MFPPIGRAATDVLRRWNWPAHALTAEILLDEFLQQEKPDLLRIKPLAKQLQKGINRFEIAYDDAGQRS